VCVCVCVCVCVSLINKFSHMAPPIEYVYIPLPSPCMQRLGWSKTISGGTSAQNVVEVPQSI